MRDAASFRSLAENLRKLAESADDMTAANLRAIADEYDEEARRMDVEGPAVPMPE